MISFKPLLSSIKRLVHRISLIEFKSLTFVVISFVNKYIISITFKIINVLQVSIDCVFTFFCLVKIVVLERKSCNIKLCKRKCLSFRSLLCLYVKYFITVNSRQRCVVYFLCEYDRFKSSNNLCKHIYFSTPSNPSKRLRAHTQFIINFNFDIFDLKSDFLRYRFFLEKG